MDEIITRVLDLPLGIKGATVKDENDDYNIYINALYPRVVQEIAYRHELEHIYKDHFYKGCSVREKEDELRE